MMPMAEMRDREDIALPGIKARLARRRASPDRPRGGRSCTGSRQTTVGCDLTINRHRKTADRPPAVGQCPAHKIVVGLTAVIHSTPRKHPLSAPAWTAGVPSSTKRKTTSENRTSICLASTPSITAGQAVRDLLPPAALWIRNAPGPSNPTPSPHHPLPDPPNHDKQRKKRLSGGLQNRIRPSAISKKRRPEIAKHIGRWPVPGLACGLPDDDTGKRDLPVHGLPERLLGSLMRLYRRLRQWFFNPVGPDGLVASVANRMVTRCGCRTMWPEIRQGRISRQARPKLPRSGSSDSRSERSAMARGANSESRASILYRRTAGGRAPTSLNRLRHGQAAAWPQGRTPAKGFPFNGRLFAALSVAACRPGHPGQQERGEPHFNISHFIHPGVCSDDGRCHRAICDCLHSNTSVLPNG